MSNAYLLKPDRKFTEEIIGRGGESLKQCFQCATCSVTCELSPDDRPFPRKEMIWAQWGLKDKLIGDPDVWLCHRCSDCSIHCPRGAAPGDVLSAVRDYSIRHYAVPGFMGKALGKPGLLFLLFGIPAVLILTVLASIGHLHIPEGDVSYEHFFPHTPLQIFFTSFFLLAVLAAVVGASRFWKDMERHTPSGSNTNGIFASFIGVIKDILSHGKFKKCTQSKSRYISHLLTFYGFVGLLITTTGAVVSAYIFHFYPIPLFHPIKIVGNLSTILIGTGIIWIMYNRTSNLQDAEISTSSDWTFIGILCAVIFTGLATEILRFINVPPVAYPVYFVHLVVVFALLIYLPYSRFAHMVYRTVALVFARRSGRDVSGN